MTAVSESTHLQPVVDERPWGRFEHLSFNETSTVKLIEVQPEQRLSLQRHEHRDELWVVLDVPLEVEVGGRRWTALVGERVWIPRGTVHRLGNPGVTAGRIVEVAFGTFDEGDIERLSDDYGRNG